VIEHLPWSDFITRYDRPGTLFYLDPPYYGSEGDYGAPVRPQPVHRDGRPVAHPQGPVHSLLNDHPEVRRIFEGFTIDSVPVRYTVGGMAQSKIVGSDHFELICRPEDIVALLTPARQGEQRALGTDTHCKRSGGCRNWDNSAFSDQWVEWPLLSVADINAFVLPQRRMKESGTVRISADLSVDIRSVCPAEGRARRDHARATQAMVIHAQEIAFHVAPGAHAAVFLGSSRVTHFHRTGRSTRHNTDAAPAPLPRTQSGRKRLAVHARQLAVQPHIQILRRYRRPLLLRVE
jgi:hypothetical protein